MCTGGSGHRFKFLPILSQYGRDPGGQDGREGLRRHVGHEVSLMAEARGMTSRKGRAGRVCWRSRLWQARGTGPCD